ncbi:MAG TPA: TolC family protein [Bacteroidia bacterium]|nr:TolC family protein [Bacteroidia bacterium]
MKLKITGLFIALLFFPCVVVNAQDPGIKAQDTTDIKTKILTLEQCIEYALQNNIQIKQSELNSEIAGINLVQSEASLLPSLNANASHSYNFGRTIDRFTNQFASSQVLSQNFGLSADVTLFNGLQTINTIHQNRYIYLSNKYNVDKMKNDVSLNVATAYLQILYNIPAQRGEGGIDIPKDIGEGDHRLGRADVGERASRRISGDLGRGEEEHIRHPVNGPGGEIGDDVVVQHRREKP